MGATEALYLLRRLGLSLTVNGERLDVSPAELLDDDAIWLIRSHRAALISELQNDLPARVWRVNFADRPPLETHHHPEATCVQVLRKYGGAVSAERVPECDWPHDPNKGKHANV
jgi:hypothetical protein